jgi:FixJ family two-component response regulator
MLKPGAHPRLGGTSLNLIIVDDDLDIRRAVASLLRSHGHDVLAFASAEDCLARNVEADCAILDIALPGISGLELHDRLKAQGRGMPVVFITAHDELPVLSAVQRTRRPLLKKPLDEDALLDAIARATGDHL